MLTHFWSSLLFIFNIIFKESCSLCEDGSLLKTAPNWILKKGLQWWAQIKFWIPRTWLFYEIENLWYSWSIRGDMVKFYRAGRWWRWGQVWDWVWTTRWRRSRRREPWLAACRPRARRPNGAVRFPGNGSRRFSSSDPKAPPVPTRSQSEAAKVQRKMTFTFQAGDNSRSVCPWLRASGKPGVTQLKFTDLIWSASHLKITRLDDSCNRCAYKMWNVIKWPKQ